MGFHSVKPAPGGGGGRAWLTGDDSDAYPPSDFFSPTGPLRARLAHPSPCYATPCLCNWPSQCTVVRIMTKYTLSEKTVKQHLGPAYRPMSYKQDVDYIERKAFRGVRRIYRSDLLDGTLACDVAEQEQPVEELVPVVQVTPVPEPQQLSVSDVVTEQTIVMLYPNSRWVKTDMADKVFVGARGFNFRKGQKIRVKNKTICIR